MRRDVGHVVEVGTPAFVQALDDAVVALMIEKKAAVEDLEAILSVAGIDMVQFGPADYAMSLGLAGQWDHPAVREAERHVVDTALRKAIAPRAGSAPARPSAPRHGRAPLLHGLDLDHALPVVAGQGAALRRVLRRAAAGRAARPAPAGTARADLARRGRYPRLPPRSPARRASSAPPREIAITMQATTTAASSLRWAM